MKCENKVRLMYRTSGGACFAILNEPYRLDGSLIVEGDSVASVTESAMRADKWVTINGAHVLIGKGNTVIAGMENKYGKDGMYGKMTDAEFDKYQELENHKYDYFYKQ